MDHVAIMKKEWRLVEKILRGEKTVESRWYKTRRVPWDRIAKDETVYFKDSGFPITVRATVSKVAQFENLTPEKITEILEKYPLGVLGAEGIKNDLTEAVKDKNYCIMISLDNPKPVEPFEIDKTGFGLMSAWICVEDISTIKQK